MKGLLIRDLYILLIQYLKRPMILTFIISFILSIIIGFPISSMLSLILPMTFGTLSTNIFIDDEKDNWFKYIKTMPISNYAVVISRFIIFNLISLLTVIYCFSLNLVSYQIHQEQVFLIYLIFSCAGLILSLINNLLLLPFCFKFGARGANIISIIILIIIGIIAYIIKIINLDLLNTFVESIPLYIFEILGIMGVVILSIISIKSSVKIFDNIEIN